jgi:hypothetical protein
MKEPAALGVMVRVTGPPVVAAGSVPETLQPLWVNEMTELISARRRVEWVSSGGAAWLGTLDVTISPKIVVITKDMDNRITKTKQEPLLTI